MDTPFSVSQSVYYPRLVPTQTLAAGIFDDICELLAKKHELFLTPTGLVRLARRSVVRLVKATAGHIYWSLSDEDRDYPTAILLACLQDKTSFHEVRKHWLQLVETLEFTSGFPAPYEVSRLKRLIADHTVVRQALGDLAVSIFETFEGLPATAVSRLTPEQLEADRDFAPLFADYLYGKEDDTSQVDLLLSDIIREGGTALLFGATGSFKTSTVKRLAVKHHAKLVVMKGSIGKEDREFFGQVTKTVDGVAFVDGELSEAFRAAASERTVLLIDEVLRFNLEHLNVLIGALDTYEASELRAMGCPVCEEGWYYQVKLPTGERLVAPTRLLAIIGTTNVDLNHNRGQLMSDALLRRFKVQLDVAYPDERKRKEVYGKACDHERIVAKVIQLENSLREKTLADGSRLVREPNPALMLSLLETWGRLRRHVDETYALRQSVLVTVVPFCVARDSHGVLDAAGKQIIMDLLEKGA
jgi:MoxR-like ATPase